MEFVEVNNFSLRETILSGQFFNFVELCENSFNIVDGKNSFFVEQKGNKLFFEGCSKDYLFEFLGLNFDVNCLDLGDFYFKRAFNEFSGIRVMKIDLFQTIISFVCSAASNQKKIENNIKLISEKFGEKINGKYLFPSCGKINSHKLLIECKVGYRAKYILAISNYLNENPTYLDDLREFDYKKAHEMLQILPGVGSKVADCICLFGLNHFEAFPVDTWVKKILKEYYSFEGSQRELEIFARKKFGKLGGYYQQYLFHYARVHGIDS